MQASDTASELGTVLCSEEYPESLQDDDPPPWAYSHERARAPARSDAILDVLPALQDAPYGEEDVAVVFQYLDFTWLYENRAVSVLATVRSCRWPWPAIRPPPTQTGRSPTAAGDHQSSVPSPGSSGTAAAACAIAAPSPTTPGSTPEPLHSTSAD